MSPPLRDENLPSPTAPSRLLKLAAGKLQRPAVLGDVPDELLGGPVGKVHLDLQGNIHASANEAGQVLHNLLGDPGRVPAQAQRVQLDGPVEPADFRLRDNLR